MGRTKHCSWEKRKLIRKLIQSGKTLKKSGKIGRVFGAMILTTITWRIHGDKNLINNIKPCVKILAKKAINYIEANDEEKGKINSVMIVKP